MLRIFMFVSLLAFAAGAADNLLPQPLSGWQRNFRPADRKDVFEIREREDGGIRVRRFANSTFGRLYCDVKIAGGGVYRLRYDQTTEHGALTKLLITFRGADGKWRDSSRLSHVEPLVCGEWRTGDYVFTVPDDAAEARIDYRLDSFGTVDLKNFVLTRLTAEEAAAATAAPPSFEPGKNGDRSLTPGQLYRIELEGRAVSGDGTLTLRFHVPETGFIRDDSITFFLRDRNWKTVREAIVAADNVNGVRLSVEGAEIRNLRLTPIR